MSLDMFDVIEKFRVWWESESEIEVINPYDAVEQFTDTYVVENVTLPFSIKSLRFWYVEMSVKIIHFVTLIVTVFSYFYDLFTNYSLIFNISWVIYIPMAVLFWVVQIYRPRLKKEKSDIIIQELNMKNELNSFFYQDHKLSGFVYDILERMKERSPR